MINKSQCYFDYVFKPISIYRKLIFDEIIKYIPNGDVADIGSGSVGWYWALAYILKSKKIDFLDINNDFLQKSFTNIEKITPEWLHEKCLSTINYLKEKGYINNVGELAEQFVNLEIDFIEYNFLLDKLTKKYDTILAIESLEIVKTVNELKLAFNNLIKGLKPNGFLGFSVALYDENNSDVKEMQKIKLEGYLNPRIEIIESIINDLPVNVDFLKLIKVPENNYSNVIIGRLYKKSL